MYFQWSFQEISFPLNHAVFRSSKIHIHKKQTSKILETRLVGAEVKQTNSNEQGSAHRASGPVVKNAAPALEGDRARVF